MKFVLAHQLSQPNKQLEVSYLKLAVHH